MRLPTPSRCLCALFVLLTAAAPLPAEARSGWRWAAELRLAGGYDSNAFLDAAALPSASNVDEAGGPMLRVAPALTLGWAPTLGQELLIGYLAQLDQYLGGDVGRETALRHGPLLAYLPPAFLGFDLLIQGGLQQLLFRTSDVGWLQAFGRVRLGRGLGERWWLGLAYLGGHVAYQAGAVADGDPSSISAVQNEWTHNLEATLRWRPRPTLLAELGYTLTRVLAQPRSFLDKTVQPPVFRVPPDEAFDAWRQGGGLTLRWRPWQRLRLEASYRFWWIGYDAGKGSHGGLQLGPPPTVPIRTFLHEVGATAELELWRPLALFASYAASLGSTTYWGPGSGTGQPVSSSGSYARHLAVVGLRVHFGGRSLSRSPASLDAGAPKGAPAGLLRLRVEAAGARHVAVIGTFNGWDHARGQLRREGSRWVGEFELPAGEHRYMLWIDGVVRPPPDCQSWIADGFGGRNCTVSSDGGARGVSPSPLGRK